MHLAFYQRSIWKLKAKTYWSRTLLTLEVTIETDKHGEHVVVFPGRREELIPPRDYDERLQWIQNSFETFLLRVRELEAIRRAMLIN